MTVKAINKLTAKSLLSSIGMTVGDWERLEYSSNKENHHALSYQAPQDARKLYCFSLQAATWLPVSSWKLLQIDMSSTLAWHEGLILARLLLGEFDCLDFTKTRSFLFEFGDKQDTNRKCELIIANVIYFSLLYESHMYITSSASTDGQILAIQDGFVGFISRETDISGAHEVIKEYENNPLNLPRWLNQFDIINP